MTNAPQENPDLQDGAAAASSSPQEAETEKVVTYRRAPSIVAFIIVGVVVGLLVALVSTIFGPESQSFTFGAVYGIMAMIFAPLGAALGAVIALILDRRSVKRQATYKAVPFE